MFFAMCLSIPVPVASFEYDAGNGNRDYYADDERGLAYGLDRIYSRFVAYDWSGNEVYSTALSGAPISMDLSKDGSKAYIACDGAQRVSVVDLDLRTMVDDMALDFVPHGIACGEGTTVFISSLDDGLVRKVDVSTDTVIWTEDIGMSGVLYSSPDGGRLLSFQATGDGARAKLYDVSGVPEPMATSSILGNGFAGAAIDWAGGDVYVAMLDSNELQRLSLSDLQKSSGVEVSGRLSSVTLSGDGKKLVTISNTDGPATYLTVINETDLKMVGTLQTVTGIRAVIVNEDCTAYQRPGYFGTAICAQISIMGPYEGDVYAFTPSFVYFSIYQGLFQIDRASVNVSIEGEEGTIRLNKTFVYDDIKCYLGSELPDGDHRVNISYIEGGEIRNKICNFKVDRSDPLAIRPTIAVFSPIEGEVLSEAPDAIRIWANMTWPEPKGFKLSLEMDGLDLEISDDPYWGQVKKADISVLKAGVHTVNATMSWGGHEETLSWSFILRELPSVISLDPGDGTMIYHRPSEITAVLDPGFPPCDVLNATMVVDDIAYPCSTDGMVITAMIPSEHWNRTGDLWDDYHFTNNVHFVRMDLETSFGPMTKEWYFDVRVEAPVLEMEVQKFQGRYGVPVPLGWSVTENGTIGDQTFDLVGYTDYYEYFAQVYVMTGRDDSIKETDGYLKDMMQDLLGQLSEDITLVGEPEYIEIAGHRAVVFTMTYGSFITFHHRCAIIVSEDSDEFWMLNCLTYSGYYEELSPTFDSMIMNFEVYAEREPLASPGDYAIYLILFGSIGAAVTAIVIVHSRRRRQ